MKQIAMTNSSLFALVDDEDYDLVSKRKWLCSRGYVCSCSSKEEILQGNPDFILLHRFVMNAPEGTLIDHADMNPLNNMKSNLRFCSRAQNAWNSKKHRDDVSSSYQGVCWSPTKKFWRATAKCNNNQVHLGYFETEIEAAKAYDTFARDNFGEFARLNFPDSNERVVSERKEIIRTNKSGYRGVSWSNQQQKWQAQFEIRRNGKRKAYHIGFFDDPVEASLAYIKAKEEYHNKVNLEISGGTTHE